ncbi:MAG: SNF2-related protein [Microthrixaceae bacterium]
MPQADERLPDSVFDALVDAEIDGMASDDEIAQLFAEAPRWRRVLLARLDEADDAVERAKRLDGPERDQVAMDFLAIGDEVDAALDRLDIREGRELPEPEEPPATAEHGEPLLQASWSPSRVVVWVGGADKVISRNAELTEVLADLGAPTDVWTSHEQVALPDNRRAAALSAPMEDVIGWLLGHAEDERLGASARWLGQLGLFGVSLVARGWMVPLLRHRHRTEGSGTFAVRWHPVMVDDRTLEVFAGAAPAAVFLANPELDARSATRSALVAAVDAVCVQAARQIEAPAPPPRLRTPTDLAEAYLGRLDGSSFRAPVDLGRALVRFLDEWAEAVAEPPPEPLVVRLQPPGDSDGWQLSVLGRDADGALVAVQQAITSHPGEQAQAALVDGLMRAERLVPELKRAGAQQRGEAVLSEAEAWEVMSTTSGVLIDAGFELEVPRAGRAPRPSLQLTALDGDKALSATELAHVRWSVLFGDVELSAAQIHELAQQAAPLVESNGSWVRIDEEDLAAASEALAGRSEQMTGGEMLRWAVGLHGSPREGGVSVAEGWAANLVGAARAVSTDAAEEPDGFSGKLRMYQRDALAWLQFCDSAGLGGCLSLDMGLGKTPTVLAHVLATAGAGPTLVVAPPAVVGNWASEAARFTPGLRVTIHHGADRATADEITSEVASADMVITTYGTALRDLEELCGVDWQRVVLDEAQAIKNPASNAARGLRQLPSRYRLAMTGTPVENSLGDLWAILDFANPDLVGDRAEFVAELSHAGSGEAALRVLNGILVFRRTKAEPEIAAELPERIDETDHCTMTAEQIGLYQAVLDELVKETGSGGAGGEKGSVLTAITKLKQICNHPAAFTGDDEPLDGRSGKLARLEEIIDTVFSAGERVVVFTQYASWAVRLAEHLSKRTGKHVAAYHGGLPRTARDGSWRSSTRPRAAARWCRRSRRAARVSNLTAANHVVLFDRWWNPVEDQARDRAWRLDSSARSSSTASSAPGRSTNAPRRSSRASVASRIWCCRSRARSRTSTPTRSRSASAAATTRCSPTTCPGGDR